MWCMVLLSFIENVQAQIGGDDDPARFRPTVMSSSSFDAFKISEITFENGSTSLCAAQCVHSRICSRFLLEGQTCHLFEYWQFLKEDQDNGSFIDVYELITEDWSQVLLIGGNDDEFFHKDVEAVNLKSIEICPNPPYLSNSRNGAPAFFMAGHIYHAFGKGSSGEFNHSLQFNKQSQTWERFGFLPADTYYSAVAQIRDSWVLVIGGRDSRSTYVMYWNETIVFGPPLPFEIERHCAIGVDRDHIFVAGGQNETDNYNREAFVLKWSDQEWVRQQPMTSTIHPVSCEAFLDKDKQYNIIVGSDTFEIFNWANRTWRPGPSIMSNFFQGQFTRFNGILYMFGRSNETAWAEGNNLFIFDPMAEKWTKTNLNLPIGRNDFGIVRIPSGIIDC